MAVGRAKISPTEKHIDLQGGVMLSHDCLGMKLSPFPISVTGCCFDISLFDVTFWHCCFFPPIHLPSACVIFAEARFSVR